MIEEFDFEEMEIPTPCIICGELFDLHDGGPSNDIDENIIVCPCCMD